MKLELKHLAPYLPYGLKVQYEGIINGKELSIWDKKLKDAQKEYDDIFADIDEPRPEEILGLKVGRIISVHPCKTHTRYSIGIKRGKVFYNLNNVKPILRPLSDIKYHLDFLDKYYVDFDKQEGTLVVKRKNENYTRLNELNYLFEHHFDVFGLIDKGFAIDINTIKQ